MNYEELVNFVSKQMGKSELYPGLANLLENIANYYDHLLLDLQEDLKIESMDEFFVQDYEPGTYYNLKFMRTPESINFDIKKDFIKVELNEYSGEAVYLDNLRIKDDDTVISDEYGEFFEGTLNIYLNNFDN